MKSNVPRPTGQSLPRTSRIARRREFLEIYESGTKEAGRFAVLFLRSSDLAHPRLGVTVTKKAGKAHVRNRLKRWTREVFRTSRGPTGLEALGLDVVVNVKPSAATTTFVEFSNDLARLFRRAAAKQAR